MSTILVFVLLLIPSALIWKVIHSVIFRITGDDDRPVLVAVVFLAIMVALAALFGLLLAFHYPSYWLLMPYSYCLVAAVIVVVGLILKAFGFAFENLIAAIRGD